MKYIITGATSFIGIALSKYLIEKGEQVIAVCRSCSENISNLPNGASVVISDLYEFGVLDSKIQSADVFVNLEWEEPKNDNCNSEDVQKNVDYTVAAMCAAYKMGCKLFVERGSQLEYGYTLESQCEDMECHPFSEYGKAKLIVKDELFKLSERLRMKYLHLRMFSIIGDNDHTSTFVMSTLDKMLKDETVDLSSCTQNWNFLYVKDAVRYIVGLIEYAFASDDFMHEVFNIASDDTRPLKCFVEKMRVLSHSLSSINYGVLTSEFSVSLQPDTSKLKRAIPFVCCEEFDDIVKEIIRAIRNNRPDIFVKTDNFKTFDNVRSFLMFGDLQAMEKPLISVIMPVYNRPHSFQKSLESVLNQDCAFPYEVIVVDNNDCEGRSANLEIVELHATDNLYYYRNEKNIGGYGNFNRGVELSRAEYITFCHDDDLFMPHALRTLWNLHLKSGVKCITSKFVFINDEGIAENKVLFPTKRWKGHGIEKPSHQVSLIDQFMWPTGLDICNLYNRSCFMELGGYNPAHHPSCDNSLLTSYTYYYGAVVCNIPCWMYRHGDNNASEKLWSLFADNHLFQRRCMAKKIKLPHFLLRRVYMALYHRDIVQHRIFWGKESQLLWKTVPKMDLLIISVINYLLRLKQFSFRLFR